MSSLIEPTFTLESRNENDTKASVGSTEKYCGPCGVVEWPIHYIYSTVQINRQFTLLPQSAVILVPTF